MNRFVLLTALALVAASCGTKIDPVSVAPLDSFEDVEIAPEGVTWCGNIQKLLARFCTSCHSSTLQGADRNGAPEGRNWDVYETTVANADLIKRMIQGGAMPPTGRLPDVDIALFVEWTTTGLRECRETASEEVAPDVPVTGDTGTTEAVDPGTPDPGPISTACSSNERWTPADGDGPLMRPGEKCSTCHDAGGNRLVATGTVMGALHDEDDCNGVQNVVVLIKGSDGQSRTKKTNAAGNFSLDSGEPIATPYTARVSYDGHDQAMITSPSDLHCGNCHTAAGLQGAPGRIVAPGL